LGSNPNWEGSKVTEHWLPVWNLDNSNNGINDSFNSAEEKEAELIHWPEDHLDNNLDD